MAGFTGQYFHSFNDFNLDDFLRQRLGAFEKDIESLAFTHKGAELEKQIQNSYSIYHLTPLTFKPEEITVNTVERSIPAFMFPRSGFIVDEDASYTKPVWIFYLPFIGEEILLRSIPSTRIMRSVEIGVSDRCVVFEAIQFYEDGRDVMAAKVDIVNLIQAQAENVNKEVEKFNISLLQVRKSALGNVQLKVDQRSAILEKMGIGMKNAVSTPRVGENVKTKISKVTKVKKISKEKYDVFISHAGEDGEYSSKLTQAIENEGMRVWYDRGELSWGDDLRSTIDLGLINSKYAIVVFSKAFLGKKDWTEYELDSLVALEKNGRKVILPVWHGITRDELVKYSPKFADRLAKISDSTEEIVKELKKKLAK